MKCPRCKQAHDILRYIPMGQAEEFLAETYPVYRCPSCRWIFSPAPTIDEKVREAHELLRQYAPELLVAA